MKYLVPQSQLMGTIHFHVTVLLGWIKKTEREMNGEELADDRQICGERLTIFVNDSITRLCVNPNPIQRTTDRRSESQPGCVSEQGRLATGITAIRAITAQIMRALPMPPII